MSCVFDIQSDGIATINLKLVVVEILAGEMFRRCVDRNVDVEHDSSSFLVIIVEPLVQKREIRHEPVNHNRSKRPDDYRNNQDRDNFT